MALHAADPRTIHCASQTEANNIAQSYAVVLGGEVHFTSGTPSMIPVIPARKIAVIVHRKPFAELRRDEIALRTDGLCHRAIRQQGERWIAKGDNCAVRDSVPLTAKNFVGVVVLILDFP